MESNVEQAGRQKWVRPIAIGALALAALTGIGVGGAFSDNADRMQRAWGGHGGMQASPASMRHAMGFGGFGRMLGEIDATDEQEDKLQAIMDQLHDDVRPTLREMRDTRKDLAEM